jgi:hypothetical protein
MIGRSLVVPIISPANSAGPLADQLPVCAPSRVREVVDITERGRRESRRGRFLAMLAAGRL